MIDHVLEHWPVLVAFFGGFIWVGRISQRVDTLEKDPKVTVAACGRQMSDCKAHIESEFSHGSREFDEVKKTLELLRTRQDESDQASELRHRELLNILLEKN